MAYEIIEIDPAKPLMGYGSAPTDPTHTHYIAVSGEDMLRLIEKFTGHPAPVVYELSDLHRTYKVQSFIPNDGPSWSRLLLGAKTDLENLRELLESLARAA